MYYSRHIVLRKIIAAFLLCLLGLIYTGKAYHHHEKRIPGNLHTVVTETTRSADCTICEFQLAKDSGLPILLQAERPVTGITNVYGYTLINPVIVPHTDIPARGPPVC